MEAIYLACGAGGPQLKRNPLGSVMTNVPTWWQHIFLAGYGLIVLVTAASLWRMRGDSSAQAKRRRQETVGVCLVMAVVPISILLERRLDLGPYILLLALVTGLGIVLYLRGRQGSV